MWRSEGGTGGSGYIRDRERFALRDADLVGADLIPQLHREFGRRWCGDFGNDVKDDVFFEGLAIRLKIGIELTDRFGLKDFEGCDGRLIWKGNLKRDARAFWRSGRVQMPWFRQGCRQFQRAVACFERLALIQCPRQLGDVFLGYGESPESKSERKTIHNL